MVVCKMKVRVKNALLHKLGFVQPYYFYTAWSLLFHSPPTPKNLRVVRRNIKAELFAEVTLAPSLATFRTQLKTFLLTESFSDIRLV